jgi:hypothetical protein
MSNKPVSVTKVLLRERLKKQIGDALRFKVKATQKVIEEYEAQGLDTTDLEQDLKGLRHEIRMLEGSKANV